MHPTWQMARSVSCPLVSSIDMSGHVPVEEQFFFEAIAFLNSAVGSCQD